MFNEINRFDFVVNTTDAFINEPSVESFEKLKTSILGYLTDQDLVTLNNARLFKGESKGFFKLGIILDKVINTTGQEKLYNKLVRDKIPEIISSSGNTPITYTETDQIKLLQRAKTKLKEELKEFIEGPTLEEAADVTEVAELILTLHKQQVK